MGIYADKTVISYLNTIWNSWFPFYLSLTAQSELRALERDVSFIQKVILISIVKEVRLTRHHIALVTEMNNVLTPVPNVFRFTTLPRILIHQFSLMSSLNITLSEKEGALLIILSYENTPRIKHINSVS